MTWKPLLAAALLAALTGGNATLSPAQTAAPAAARPSPQPFSSSRISVQVSGTGPDVILIPGLTASSDVWRGTVAGLPGYRYHLVQVSGFAGTPVRGNGSGAVIAPLAAEIARYIETRQLQRPALIGHSMGGTLAMMVAAQHPSQVGKVMVVDMLPQPAGIVGASASGVRGLADALRGLGDSEDGRRVIASAIRMFGNADADTRPSDPDLVARATHELALTDLGPALAKIQAPLTVVYASPDASRNAAADRSYASGYGGKKGVRLIRVDQSGHMVMYDQPAKFRAALKTFLES
ncbi:alpha/beta fold hydrolase [Sphingomonas parva]|nr:alpha/beta hydrolase [Sphingomonas parva]